MAGPDNVVLLSVDALRADHLTYHGYERETSPFLDDLAGRGTTFETAISASCHTREAAPALLTGRYPELFADNGYELVAPSLASRLGERGLAAGAFHSNPFVSRAYGYDEGFDAFDDDLRFSRSRLVALAQRALDKFLLRRGRYHVRAEELNRRSLEWIDSLDENRPFFLWNHYMDVHGPYNPPAEHSTYADRSVTDDEAQDLYEKSADRPEDLTPEERQLLVDLYDGEIRYLDAAIESFLDALGDRGLLEDTMVIVTSDHGDGLGEHGYYTHPRELHEELIHVPLILLGPGRPATATGGPVSLVDVVPTVLAAFGEDPGALPGVPLGDSPDDRAVIASASCTDGPNRTVAVRGPRWKLHATVDPSAGRILEESLYDLDDDPGEQSPVDPSRHPDRAAECRSVLRSHLERDREDPETSGTDGETPERTAEVEERLEYLGYR